MDNIEEISQKDFDKPLNGNKLRAAINKSEAARLRIEKRKEAMRKKGFDEDAIKREFGEEYEPIEELSRKTLGSYIGKAGEDKAYFNNIKGEVDSTRRSVDHKHEYDPETRRLRDAYSSKLLSQADKLNKKIWNREDGIRTAIKKLTKEENEEMSEDNRINETSAADTLHPGAGSGGTESRAQMLDTFVQLLAKLGKEDLTSFYNNALAQIGHEADAVPGDAAAKNMATIATKTGVKEAVEDMFGSDETLSEEFKEKASTIFEAALNSRITIETARLEEEFEELAEEMAEELEVELQEQADAIFEEVSEKLDQYLDYVVEQWMEENALTIENSLRADIAEDFLAGLQNLFAEHYINVPTDRLDVFGEMKSEIEALKAKLNETIDENISLQTVIDEATKAALIDEVSEGMVVTESEKLRTLSEGIEYTDAETYRKKVEIVKENYFNKKTAAATGLITESVDGTDTTADEVRTPAVMSKYVDAIAKSVK